MITKTSTIKIKQALSENEGPYIIKKIITILLIAKIDNATLHHYS